MRTGLSDSGVYFGTSETCRQAVRKIGLDTPLLSSLGKPQLSSEAADRIRPTQVVQDHLWHVVKTVDVNHTFTAASPVPVFR